MLIRQATLIFWFIVQERFWEAFSHTWDTGNMMYVQSSSAAGLCVCFVGDSEYERKVEGYNGSNGSVKMQCFQSI
jgi:hypothetical protein